MGQVKRMEKIGRIFQLTMMIAFMITLMGFGKSVSWTSPLLIPSHLGALLFLYCLYILYIKKYRVSRLITTGPFKYTRHPMYTGLALMSAVYWLPTPPNDILFFTVQGVFIFSLVAAAYCQEKETLARFEGEAEDYYARTPRLFFCYPFRTRVVSLTIARQKK